MARFDETILNKSYNIFNSGSRTYFNSSIFFPRKIRDKIAVLYAFVRTADDYIDSVPSRPEELHSFIAEYRKVLSGGKTDNDIIKAFHELQDSERFEQEWIDSFLECMLSDIHKKRYNTLEELERYMYGSAEVIGLMMSRVLGFSRHLDDKARLLGKSMQFINFIRDIKEDAKLGRQYIPTEILEKYEIEHLTKEEALKKRSAFSDMIHRIISIYRSWDREARKAFSEMPRKYMVPIKTASDMYRWTAGMIYRNPLVVFEQKIRPGKLRVILMGIRNFVSVV